MGERGRIPHGSLQELEDELQSELDKARIRPRISAADYAERRGTHTRVGRSELRPVKEVEKFSSELKAQFFIGTETSPLKHGEVKVVHPGGAERGIDAGFIAEGKVGWRGEARGVE